MKIAWIPHPRFSHIQPILNLLESLSNEKNVELYVLCTDEYRSFFEKTRVTVCLINFEPKEIENIEYNAFEDIIKIPISELEDYVCEKMEHVHLTSIFENNCTRLEIKKTLKDINADLIIRDSLDSVGLEFSRENKTPLVTYVTNNIYPFEYITNSVERFQLYYSFEKLPSILVRLFKDTAISLMKKSFDAFIKKYNYDLYFFSNREPKENLVIACTSKIFLPQPLKDVNYLINTRFAEDYIFDESMISSDEQEFVMKSSQDIIYIACGSYMKLPKSYYEKYIDFFINKGFAVIVSTNFYNSHDFDYNSNNVLIKKSVNQNYILSHSKLFISSGGQNSILESIFYEVPLFIDPQVNEQVLNGYLVEEKMIGLTSCNIRNSPLENETLLSLLISYYPLFKANICDISAVLHSELLNTKINTNQIIKKILQQGRR